MIVYQSDKAGFLGDVLSNNISDIIHYNFVYNPVGEINYLFQTSLTGNGGCIQLATNTYTRLTILPNGNVGINTSNPSNTLDVNPDTLSSSL